jgi:predicted regulator of Ras-like GTPase activity (Roadblock/LC7/MglB family)
VTTALPHQDAFPDASPAPREGSLLAALGERVAELVALHALRGGLIAGADGFVIAANLPPDVAAAPLAALGSALGRQLELLTARVGEAALDTAYFSATDGTLFVGATPIGFLVLFGDRSVNAVAVRKGLQEALRAVRGAWPDAGTPR